MYIREFFIIVMLAGYSTLFAQGEDIWADLEQSLSSSSVSELSSSGAAVPDTSGDASQQGSAVGDIPSSSSAAVPLSSVVTQISSSSSVAVQSAPADTAAVVDRVNLSIMDSVPPVSSEAESSSSAPESSSSQGLSSSSAPAVVAPLAASSSSFSRRDLLGPVKVSRVNAIDGMKGQYRSPRRALFMSLVVPGSGQLYVGGSTMNYVRGAGYLAVEAGLLSGWYYYSVYKYDRQVKRYKNFAKKHYSPEQYETLIHGLWNQLDDATQESNFQKLYGGVRQDYCRSIYGNPAINGCFSNDTTFVRDGAHQSYLNGKSLENLKLYDEDGLFYSISNDAFVLGWNDVTDVKTVAELNVSSETDYSYVTLGSSENLDSYLRLRGRANDLADMQAWFLGGLLLNHIVSAIDATLAARAHNMSLYEEKLSWLDKVRLDSHVAIQDGFSATLNAVWGF